MPELPEVETIARGLKQKIIEKTIESVEILNSRPIAPLQPKVFAGMLKGETFNEIGREGKYLVFSLKSGKVIVAHLRMTGKYIFQPRRELMDLKHIRLIFNFTDKTLLYYMDVRIFGTLRVYNTYREAAELKHLSPDLLSDSFNAKWIISKARHRTIPIKTLLLDQAVASGMGNIYSCEALFRARISPLIQANKLKRRDVERLIVSIKELLALAITKNGTSISDFRNVEDERGDFQTLLKVYQKAGEKCSVCKKGIIKRVVIAQRSTFYCPVCQKRR